MPVEPLTVRGLRVSFGGVAAVDGLDLSVAAGTIAGLVGPNGCGKTTTLRAVVGLVQTEAGSVLVDGVRGGTIAGRSRVGYVPDEPTGLDELTVREYTDLVGALWRADPDYGRRRDVLLDGFELSARQRAPLRALSHGQRRLVSIVAAAALDRPLLLVDEATAALDPEAVLALREVLRAVGARGAGVLLATQDLHFAEIVCDRVTLLSAGRAAADGTVAAVREQFGAATLEEAFVAAVGASGRLKELRGALRAL